MWLLSEWKLRVTYHKKIRFLAIQLSHFCKFRLSKKLWIVIFQTAWIRQLFWWLFCLWNNSIKVKQNEGKDTGFIQICFLQCNIHRFFPSLIFPILIPYSLKFSPMGSILTSCLISFLIFCSSIWFLWSKPVMLEKSNTCSSSTISSRGRGKYFPKTRNYSVPEKNET